MHIYPPHNHPPRWRWHPTWDAVNIDGHRVRDLCFHWQSIVTDGLSRARYRGTHRGHTWKLLYIQMRNNPYGSTNRECYRGN